MNKSSLTVSRVAVVTGLVLGAFALSALASWTAPLHTPPTCLTGEPGCDAPINVSTTGQTKNGQLGLQNLITVGMQFLGPVGGPPITPLSSVLTALDNEGTVGWTTPSGGGSSSPIPNGIVVKTSSGTWTNSTNASRVRVRAWGAGGGGAGLDGNAIHAGGAGGGGGYQEGIVTVAAGATYTVTVGIGGSGGSNTNGATNAARCGLDGGFSGFSLGGTTYIRANGGLKGHSTCGDGQAYNGGLGGTYSAIANAFGINGGDGGRGQDTGVQSFGGPAPMGGAGTIGSFASVPTVPGGGGGGGVAVSGEGPGYAGAAGMVVIEY